MSFGKNKSSGSNTSTSSSSLDPQIKSLLLGNAAQAGQIAAQPYQAYTGQRVAGFNPTQLDAQRRSTEFANSGAGQGLLSEAAGLARSAATRQPLMINGAGHAAAQTRPVSAVAYQPPSVAAATASRAGDAAQAQAAQVNRGDVRDVASGAVSREAIDAYMNPYQDAVVQTSLADIERQRAVQESLANAAARKANAFGGTGAAVAASLGNEAFTRQAAQTAAELRARSYESALGAAQADAGRALDAQKSNQGADLTIGTTNAGLQNATALDNARAANQRAEFNAGLEQQTGLANADAANRAALANAQGALTAAQTNASADQTLSLADAARADEAARFAAGQEMEAQRLNQQAIQEAARMGLESARMLSSLSDQTRQQLLQDIQVAGSVGDAEQKVKQAMLDAGYEAWEAEKQHPVIMQEIRNNAIGLVGNPVLSTSKSTGTSKSSGFNISST